jgi:hypothetical protein
LFNIEPGRRLPNQRQELLLIFFQRSRKAFPPSHTISRTKWPKSNGFSCNISCGFHRWAS